MTPEATVASIVGALMAVGLIVFAIQGRAYRGVYFAAAFLAFLIARALILLTPSGEQLVFAQRGADRSLAVGSEFLFYNAPPIILAAHIVAAGGVFSGLVFRQRTK